MKQFGFSFLIVSVLLSLTTYAQQGITNPLVNGNVRVLGAFSSLQHHKGGRNGILVYTNDDSRLWRWDSASVINPLANTDTVKPFDGTMGRWVNVKTPYLSVRGLKDTVNAMGLDRVLLNGNTILRTQTIDVTNHMLKVSGDTLSFGGKGLVTRLGVIHTTNTLTPNVANLLGFPVARSLWTYPNATVNFANLAIANPALEILPTINSAPLDGSRQYLDSISELPFFIAKTKSILDTIKTRNIKLYCLDNEEVNASFRPVDSVQTPALYIATLRAFTSLLHSYGKKVANGGFTGQAALWMVWNDLFFTQGDTARAGQYARAVFQPGQISGLSTWATTGSRVVEIACYRRLIAAYQNMDFDYFNIHWIEPRNGTDSVHAQANAIKWTIQYYRKATGKPVICNELGSQSMQASLLTEMMDAWINNYVDYVVLFSGAGTTTSATSIGNDVTLIDANNNLNTIGTAVKNAHINEKNIAREIFKMIGGKAVHSTLPNPNPAAYFLTTDSAGNEMLVRAPAGNGGTVIGISPFTDTVVYQADATKLDLVFYTAGKTVTGITTDGINGSGFLPNYRTLGDSTYIHYNIAPDSTIIFIFTGTLLNSTQTTYNDNEKSSLYATNGNNLPYLYTQSGIDRLFRQPEILN